MPWNNDLKRGYPIESKRHQLFLRSGEWAIWGLPATEDETGRESGYCGRCRERDGSPGWFWS